jgi:branched-chain amino acid transport system ATP-binding protein
VFLDVAAVSMRFGGLWAVKDVSFGVGQGDIAAVIGPNGAGKTTLFNVISGFLSPTQGAVRLEGRVISGRPAEESARMGIARTFQTPEVCRDMTVLENVLVGAHLHIRGGPIAQLASFPASVRSEQAARAEAQEALQRTNLWPDRALLAGALPLGKVRLLEIARALMVRPSVVLLDESASGLNAHERSELTVLIRQLRVQGITVLLIEHNVQFVLDLADRVVVLDNGRLLSLGAPAEVRNDPAVISAYLGRQRA